MPPSPQEPSNSDDHQAPDEVVNEDEFDEDSHSFGPLVYRQDNGEYGLNIPGHIRDLLLWLADELDSSLDSDSADLTRLFPTAYADDPEMDAGYQVLAHGQLIDQRREAIQMLQQSALDVSLDDEKLNAWMRVINDVRLILGTRLDVSEESHEIDADDPNAGFLEIYHVLGILLSEIVDALTGALPVNLDDESA